MSRRLYILLICLTPLMLAAQVVSNGGRFAVDFDRGCAPLEINVTSLDSFGTITRQYFYEEGVAETTDTFYTYTSPGTYEIVQLVGIDVNPKTDTLVITVFDPTEPKFSVEKCNLNGISVTSEEDIYDFIRVYFTATDSATLMQGEVASFNYGSTSNQTFITKGFYNGAKENCSTRSFEVTPLSSLTTPNITGASIKETCLDHFVLVLDLENFDPLIDYRVLLAQNTTSTVYEGTIRDNQLVIAGVPYSRSETEYCITINALDNCTSNTVSGTPFCVAITENSATPFSGLYSSYTEDGVFINLDSVFVGSLMVYRKLGETGEFELRNVVRNDYTDPIGSRARRYFYRIDYLDTCNQVLFTAETNPPLLDSRRMDENSYSISFTDPSNDLGTITSIEYELGNEMTTTEPIIVNDFDIALNPENGTRQFLQASVEYMDGTRIGSNQFTYKYESVIHVPTAFTPNGDGKNDTLELFGLPNENATTRIYTRWGKLIYFSDEPSPGWNGFIGGDLAPEGVYLYEVIFEDSDGVKVTQKGTFALIKK